MNYKKVSLPLIIFLTSSLLVAQSSGPRHQGPKKHYGWERGERRGEFFEEKINKFAEKGIITPQEKQELLDSIEDLKKYRQEVWSDDKLTKEEQQSLIEKEKEVREKIRSTLEKAKEEMIDERRDPKERERIFNERIENALKNGRISQKEAKELKKQHKELLELEEKIWSDGVMTKEEQKNLLQQRRKFNERVRNIFRKEFKRRNK